METNLWPVFYLYHASLVRSLRSSIILMWLTPNKSQFQKNCQECLWYSVLPCSCQQHHIFFLFDASTLLRSFFSSNLLISHNIPLQLFLPWWSCCLSLQSFNQTKGLFVFKSNPHGAILSSLFWFWSCHWSHCTLSWNDKRVLLLMQIGERGGPP